MSYPLYVKEKLLHQKSLSITPKEPFANSCSYEIPEGYYLPQETVDGLAGLCGILKDIRHRLISEGYVIIEGRFYSPEGQLIYERGNSIQN